MEIHCGFLASMSDCRLKAEKMKDQRDGAQSALVEELLINPRAASPAAWEPGKCMALYE
jgi:hypothetical protein